MGRNRKNILLRVLLNGRTVGSLTRTTAGLLEFAYAETWLQADDATPISQSMPLQESPHRGTAAEAYFDNLLPDNNDIRRHMAERMATTSKGTLDLLAAVGRDCVGALQFIPEGEDVPPTGPIQAKEISASEIGDILRHLKSSPLGLDREKDFRISIAGAQEKTALLYWKGLWHRPRGSTPTTHILKPAMGRLPNGIDMTTSIPNEWLCLKLAEHFGLTVARAEMKNFDGTDCLVVERFDRRWSQDKKHLSRIPQEDLCQALGVPWSRKYESDGGSGITAVMNFLNASDDRERDRAEFLRAQIVFFLLGAIDGHAKNFSIFLLPTGFRLTPLYDVMTVWPALADRQIEPKRAKLAMAVGNKKHDRLGKIFRRHWEQTAKMTGFPLKDLSNLLQDVINRTGELEDFLHRIEKRLPPRLVDTVAKGVKNQVKALTT